MRNHGKPRFFTLENMRCRVIRKKNIGDSWLRGSTFGPASQPTLEINIYIQRRVPSVAALFPKMFLGDTSATEIESVLVYKAPQNYVNKTEHKQWRKMSRTEANRNNAHEPKTHRTKQRTNKIKHKQTKPPPTTTPVATTTPAATTTTTKSNQNDAEHKGVRSCYGSPSCLRNVDLKYLKLSHGAWRPIGWLTHGNGTTREDFKNNNPQGPSNGRVWTCIAGVFWSSKWFCGVRIVRVSLWGQDCESNGNVQPWHDKSFNPAWLFNRDIYVMA